MNDQDIEKLRQKFFSRFRKEVLTWGGETVDTAWTYYPSESADSEVQTSTPRLVVDRINLPHLGCPSLEFIRSVGQEWWPSRAILSDEPKSEISQTVEAIVGFYGRYLGASGYALVIEFRPEHAQDQSLKPTLWRVDARPEGVEIVFPKDERDLYDQLGAYLDLRQGWAWLINESIQAEALVTAEVEPGYLIGARPGDPHSDEDPADREDPEIEEVFSRFDVERFDTLEFLNSDENEEFPFQLERFQHWLPSSLSESLLTGEHEIFVLSQSQKFFEAIEEVAERRKVEVRLSDDDEQAYLTFQRGEAYLERDFSLPYLWTLHSGRQHHEGAVEFFRDDVEKLFSVSELYFNVKRRLEQAYGQDMLDIKLLEGRDLLIQERTGARMIRAQLDLFVWSAEGLFESEQGVERFLSLLGWSADSLQWIPPNHSLEHCPLCQKEAQLKKVIRPRLSDEMPQSIGVQLRDILPKSLWGYYALICPQHAIPVFWKSGEALQQAIGQHTHQILPITAELQVQGLEQQVELLWGDEIASGLLESSARETLRDRGALYAYAFTPDLIALSLLPLSPALCADLQPYCDQLTSQFGADRDWALNWSVELR